MNLQELAERITSLCKNQGISVRQMLSNCSLAGNVVDNIKRNSTPSVDKLMAIAKYFGVSMDYLLGIDSEKSRDENEQIYLDFFSSLSKEDLEKAYTIAKMITSDNKKDTIPKDDV